MKIPEQFTQGKSGDEALNEDKIVITQDFIGVIDGATSRQGLTLSGMTNGRFAAHALAAEIEKLPADINAHAAAKHLTAHLKQAAADAAKKEGRTFTDIWSFPAAALLLYSRAKKEIWRVADSTFLIDGMANYKVFPQEETWCQLRRAYLCAKIARGATEQELLENDPSWDLLTPLIADFKIFANYAGPYGYGVYNGTDIPEMHVEIYDASGAKEIVFASDGYPEVFGTLAETEAHIKKVLADDPLMYKIFPQVKGVKRGHVSFDDRTYVRFMCG